MTVTPDELLSKYNPSNVPAKNIFGELLEVCKEREMERPLHELAEIIENLLLKKFQPFNHSVLENAIEEITKADELLKIEDIASRIGASTKTIERLFRRYLGISPVAFRKIFQFRNALNYKLTNPEESLRNIAWGSNYYDLPYMIRTFREFTGMNTNDFFARLSHSDDKQYLYIG